MTTVRRCMTSLLVLALACPATAQTIAASAEAQAQTQPAVPAASAASRPSGKALMIGGAAVFVAGMTTAMYGFIRVGNGEYSTFGEASSRNKPLGAAGLAAAFGGGAMMLVGARARRYAPSTIAVDRSGVSVEKTFTW
jgi:hypothetical protein